MYTNGVLSLCHYALSLEGANADICPVEELVVLYFTQVIPATGLDDHARLRALVYSSIMESAAAVR